MCKIATSTLRRKIWTWQLSCVFLYDVTWRERSLSLAVCAQYRTCARSSSTLVLTCPHTPALLIGWRGRAASFRPARTTWRCSRTAERSSSGTFWRRVWGTRRFDFSGVLLHSSVWRACFLDSHYVSHIAFLSFSFISSMPHLMLICNLNALINDSQ